MSSSIQRAALGALLGLLIAACDPGNPVAPSMPIVAPPSTTFNVTLTAAPPRLTAGSSTGAIISVDVRRVDNGQPPANGTEVVINTNLGNFGVTPQGDPIQLVTLTLNAGTARTTLLATAEDVGTASLLAQVSDSSAQLTVSISEPGEAPMADFEFAVDEFTATFADASTGDPSRWSWEFGDGNTSSQQNPSHRYSAAGTFTVKLTVFNDGGSNSKNQLVTVPSGDPPSSDFSFQINGFRVDFLDASTGNPSQWSWNFGDGNVSLEQNPTHTYATAGTFTVSLTATSEIGSNTSSQLVTVPSGEAPEADFAFQANELRVNFLDGSSGSPTSWNWDFGDDSLVTPMNFQQNPIHTYEATGTYTVSLTATNAAGSGTTSQLVVVSLGSPPMADFNFVVNGLTVNFLDASTETPDEWEWNFGDGLNTTAENSKQNPTHQYMAPGSYTVSLTVSNAAGSGTTSQLVTVPADPPMAAFAFDVLNLRVSFTDKSTNNPTAWNWDFGNGAMSTQQNPVFTYGQAGAFLVTLTVSNDSGSNSISQSVTVTSDEERPLGSPSVSIDDP